MVFEISLKVEESLLEGRPIDRLWKYSKGVDNWLWNTAKKLNRV